MLTKKDRLALLEDFREIFATKDELAEMIEYFTQTLANKAEVRILWNEILVGFDAVMFELKQLVRTMPL